MTSLPSVSSEDTKQQLTPNRSKSKSYICFRCTRLFRREYEQMQKVGSHGLNCAEPFDMGFTIASSSPPAAAPLLIRPKGIPRLCQCVTQGEQNSGEGQREEDLREHVPRYTVSDAYRADEMRSLLCSLARFAHWKLDKQKDPLLFAFARSLALSVPPLRLVTHYAPPPLLSSGPPSIRQSAAPKGHHSVTQSSAISITNAIFIVVVGSVAPPRNVHVSIRVR